MYDGVHAVLAGPDPLLLAGILAVLAWWLRGLLPAVLAFVGFALIDSIAAVGRGDGDALAGAGRGRDHHRARGAAGHLGGPQPRGQRT